MKYKNRKSGKWKSQKLNKRRVFRFSVLLIPVALTVSLISYLVYGKYVHQTDEETNELTESYVSCAGTEEITEVTEKVNAETVTKTHKTSVTIANTGNVTSYIRVCLVSYWKDSSGNIVARNSVTPVGTELSTVTASGETAASATTDTTFVLNEDWIAVAVSGGNEAYDYNYYYTKPVKAGDSTPDLLANGSYITLVTEDGYIQVIEILAEAIQTEPTTAVTDAWNGIRIAADGSTLEADN